jgi:hypothetical protein
MITILIAGTRLLVFDAVPKGRKSNQQYVTECMMPLLSAQESRNRREKPTVYLIIHMANSMCHNGHQITEKMQSETIQRAPHPA